MTVEHRVQIIQSEQIKSLNISPKACMDWVEESFSIKAEAQLPAKISVHPQGNDFFTSMPCLLPSNYGRFGIKVVHRILGQQPSLGSDIMLYDSTDGRLLAIMDGSWITTMRTGAVAALTARVLKQKGCSSYSFIGLGNTARASALCLLADAPNEAVRFNVLAYKDQVADFKKRFEGFPGIEFVLYSSVDELIAQGGVILSSITDAPGEICSDNARYQPGTLLIPIHTRGFQNCDLFFDKVYGDDTNHVKGFRYFSQFKRYNEFGNVLLGEDRGRENDDERIIAYNIGLGLHDVLFAHKIYERLKDATGSSFFKVEEADKFWI